MKCRRFISPKKYTNNPLRIRVYNRLIADTDGNIGQCWPKLKLRKIEIDPRQSPREYMDTLIHEALHELMPRKKEAFILKAGTTIANLLWRLGYRRVKVKPKTKMEKLYTYKHASEVTSDEEKYLRKLCIEDIELIWKDFEFHRKDKNCFVVLVRNSKIIIAWGLIYYNIGTLEWNLSVYVHHSYRRQGIGSKIYRTLRRKNKLKNGEISVFRHDKSSTSFFDKLQS
jgi:hypothetical protein